MARRHGLWVHSGSMPLLAEDGVRRVNRSHVIAADGSIRARYDKIHMFDVTLPSGESWRESAAFAGGDRSEEHTSELQSLMRISYAVFCLKKKNKKQDNKKCRKSIHITKTK